MEESAEDIVLIIDKLELGTFSIVGEGVLGCCEAAWITIKRPEQVRALMLISPGPLHE